jgi:hypothetical protein
MMNITGEIRTIIRDMKMRNVIFSFCNDTYIQSLCFFARTEISTGEERKKRLKKERKKEKRKKTKPWKAGKQEQG